MEKETIEQMDHIMDIARELASVIDEAAYRIERDEETPLQIMAIMAAVVLQGAMNHLHFAIEGSDAIQERLKDFEEKKPKGEVKQVVKVRGSKINS